MCIHCEKGTSPLSRNSRNLCQDIEDLPEASDTKTELRYSWHKVLLD